MAVISIGIAMYAAGGNGVDGDMVQLAAPAPTYTPYPTPTAMPTLTTAPTPLPTVTPTPVPTATPRPTYTPLPTYTPYPTPTATPRPTATTSAYSYFDKGKEYHEAEHWSMAIDQYNKAIQIDPDYASAYDWRGMAYSNLGQYSLADADRDKVCSLTKYCR